MGQTLPSHDLATSARIARLEKQLESLAAVHNENTPIASVSSAIDEERELAAQRAQDEHANLLRAHALERRDAVWAPQTERLVRSELDALSEQMTRSFSVQSVDCRTSTCVAQLAWPSLGAAQVNLASLLSGSAGPGCARQIALPPETGKGDTPYSASFHLDCAQERWGQPADAAEARR
ncbi:MAG TPA: hypothetical protein VIV60_22305 [Polyangiaceae bacterium]